MLSSYWRTYWPWMPVAFTVLALSWWGLWLVANGVALTLPFFLERMMPEVLMWNAFGLIAPLVFTGLDRWSFSVQPLSWKWSVHVLLAVLFSAVAHAVSMGLFTVYFFAAEALGVSLRGPLLARLGESVANMFSFGLPMGAIVYGLLAALALAANYVRRLRAEEQRSAALRVQLAEARLEALKMQLHPHFLFNTLNTISATLHANPDAADRMLTLLGDFLRHTLDHAHRTQVPLHEEVDFCARYLQIEQHRFGERLTVDFQIDPAVREVTVPYLLLQPLVENAVKHGVARHLGPARVAVSAASQAAMLVIDVVNTGRLEADGVYAAPSGDGAPPPREIGLRNTRARLAQTYGPTASLDLTPTAEGVRARIRLPLSPREPILRTVDAAPQLSSS
ncbi:MAG: histidine kinase [Bacteroidota bacterium]